MTTQVCHIFHLSGAAQVLTEDYETSTTASQGLTMPGNANQACLYITTSGTAPTSIELKFQGSDDGGTTWFDELTEEVSAGSVVQLTAVRQVPPANGTYMMFLPLPSMERFRVVAKRTGGDGTTALHISATFGTV